MSKIADALDLSPPDSDDDRRQRLLELLLMITAGMAAIVLLLLAIVPGNWVGSHPEFMRLRRNLIILLLADGSIYLIGRRGSPKAGSALFILLLIALAAISDTPTQVVDGRGLIAFALPILAASALLWHWASFVVAALCSLIVALMGALLMHQTLPNIPGMLIFFILAFISYLTADSLKKRTEHLRESNAALRESEEHYRSLVEASPDAVTLTDLEGRVLMCNQRAALLHGFETVEQALGKDAMAFFAPDERPQVEEQMEETAQKGTVHRREYTLRTKDGCRFPGELSTSVIRDAQGDPVAFMGITRDIAERVRAEEGLRESERRFRLAVLQSPFPTMLHSEDGEVLLVNEVWTEITGYTIDDIPTIAAWTERAYGERQAPVRAHIERLYDQDERLEEGEYVVETKQGKERTWNFSSTPLGRLPDGRRLVLSMAVDITERKERERRLRLTEQSIEHAVYSVFWVRPDGRFLRVNATACQILGYSRQELLEMDVHDIDPNYPIERRSDFWAQIKNSSSLTIETKHKAKDGRVFPVEVSSHHVTFDDREYEVAMARDITERVRAEEELRRHREHLEELVEERTAELRKMVDLMAGREVRMTELKEVIKELRAQLEEAGLEPVANDPLLE